VIPYPDLFGVGVKKQITIDEFVTSWGSAQTNAEKKRWYIFKNWHPRDPGAAAESVDAEGMFVSNNFDDSKPIPCINPDWAAGGQDFLAKIFGTNTDGKCYPAGFPDELKVRDR
jgi:hypothetical protein